MKKEVLDKINEFAKKNGRQALSLDDLERVSGGYSTYSNGGGTDPQGNFCGMLRTSRGSDGNPVFLLTDQPFSESPEFTKLTEDEFYKTYMAFRLLIPELECLGADNSTTYRLFE